MKRCAVYTRKSKTGTDEQIQNSIRIQRISCENFIKQHDNWLLIEKEYDDIGYDGENLDRPAIQELLKDAENGAIDFVIAHKLDRISESLGTFSEILQRFAENGVSIVCVIQLNDEFITGGNPKYSADINVTNVNDNGVLELAKKYLYAQDVKTQGSLLENIVKCESCGCEMVNIPRIDGRVYACTNLLRYGRSHCKSPTKTIHSHRCKTDR